jgi:putative transposase
MARCARTVLAQIPHHVVARGVNHQPLFLSGYEKARYLKRLALIAEQTGVQVHAYCLLKDQVRLLLTPARPDSLARFFHRLHTHWALRFNRAHERSGHLFEDRFHSSPLDPPHSLAALRFVEVHPRRVQQVERLEEWEYCSAKAHLSGVEDPLVRLATEVYQQIGPAAWREFLAGSDGETEARLERALPGNRACGSTEWLAEMAQRCGRRLSWGPPGSGRGRLVSRAVVKTALATAR